MTLLLISQLNSQTLHWLKYRFTQIGLTLIQSESTAMLNGTEVNVYWNWVKLAEVYWSRVNVHQQWINIYWTGVNVYLPGIASVNVSIVAVNVYPV